MFLRNLRSLGSSSRRSRSSRPLSCELLEERRVFSVDLLASASLQASIIGDLGPIDGVYLPPVVPKEQLVGPVPGPFSGLTHDDRYLTGDNYYAAPAKIAMQFTDHLRATSTSDPHSVTNPANWQLLQDGVDESHRIASIALQTPFPFGLTSVVVTFTSELGPGTYRLIASDSIQSAVDGRPLNGDSDLVAGGDAIIDFQVSSYRSRTEVNGFGNGQFTPAIASDANGNYVAVWADSMVVVAGNQILAQRFNAAGERIGGLITIAPAGNVYFYDSVHVSMTADGRFVVGWQTSTMVAFNGRIHAYPELQLYSAEGVPVGSRINAGVAYSMLNGLAMADDGSVAVTVMQNNYSSFIPTEQQDPQNGPTIFVTRFDPAGQMIGQPNRAGLGVAGVVDIASDGRFIVAWVDTNSPSRGVVAQTFNADGTPASPIVRLSYRPGTSESPQVALDPFGAAVITWVNEHGGKRTVLAQRIDLEGQLLGPEFEVSDPDDDVWSGPSLAMGVDGRFFIGWAIKPDEHSPLRVQAFDPAATARGPALVLGGSKALANAPELAVGKFGDLIATWREHSTLGVMVPAFQNLTWLYETRPLQHFDMLEWVLAFDLNGNPAGTNYQHAYVKGGEPAPIADPESARVLADRFANFLPNGGDNVGGENVDSEFNVRIEIENYLPGDKLWSDLLPTWPGAQVISDGVIYLTSIQSIDEILRTIRYTTTANRALGSEVRIKFTGWHPAGVNVEGDTAYTTISIHEPGVSDIVGIFVFYNNSKFDGDNPAANGADDAAIATDKFALLPGEQATFANVTSYAAGINGIMVDLTGVHGELDPDDFVFRIGNSFDADYWSYAPRPLSVTVRHNQGVLGSDRVEIIWADGAIRNLWLEVTVLANGNTGLAAADAFYFGNRVGNAGGGLLNLHTDSKDALAVINRVLKSPDGYPIAAANDPHDVNRDGRINSQDLLIIFNEIGARNTALTILGAVFTTPHRIVSPMAAVFKSTDSPAVVPLIAVSSAAADLFDWELNDELQQAVEQITPVLLMEDPDKF